jgi:hypothetical protein
MHVMGTTDSSLLIPIRDDVTTCRAGDFKDFATRSLHHRITPLLSFTNVIPLPAFIPSPDSPKVALDKSDRCDAMQTLDRACAAMGMGSMYEEAKFLGDGDRRDAGISFQ